MNEYEYKATRLLADYFDDNGIPYRVINKEELEVVIVGINIEAGPSESVNFVIGDNDNDLFVIIKLINNVPPAKRLQMIEACNKLNKRNYCIRFFLNDHNDVVISYDFLMAIPDECMGEAAHEALLRTKIVLDDHYAELMKALYQQPAVKVKYDITLIKLLSEINNHNENNKDSNDSSENDEDN